MIFLYFHLLALLDDIIPSYKFCTLILIIEFKYATLNAEVGSSSLPPATIISHFFKFFLAEHLAKKLRY